MNLFGLFVGFVSWRM